MKELQTYESVKKVFEEYLQRKKLRKTSERFAILKYIFDHEGHFTAELIFNNMLNDYRVSLATVYNTLDLLFDCGLIVKHPFVGQTALFEKTFGNVFLSYLVCTKCGIVKEFSDKKTSQMVQAKHFSNFTVSHHSLYVYGLCKACGIKKNEMSLK